MLYRQLPWYDPLILKSSDGQWQEETEWHRIVSFGRLAEICGQYLVKGSKVYLEGRIQTRQWEDQSGNKRYSTEIVANELKMLDSKQVVAPALGDGKIDTTRSEGSNRVPFDEVPF